MAKKTTNINQELREKCKGLANSLYKRIKADFKNESYKKYYKTILCRGYETYVVNKLSNEFLHDKFITLSNQYEDNQIIFEEVIKSCFRDATTTLIDQMLDGTIEREIAFTYFFAVFSFYRRKRDFISCEEYFFKFQDKFNSLASQDNRFLFMKHIKVLCLTSIQSPAVTLETVELAKKIREIKEFEKMRDSVNHSFAYCLASYLEFNFDKKNNPLEQELLKEALSIEYESEYPKFLCTEGRLLVLSGDYDAGIKKIKQAIDLDSTFDIQRNIEYDGYLTSVPNMKNTEYILNQSAIIDAKLEDERKKVMKISSISISIITFILGTISVFKSVTDPKQIPGIFLMFLSCICIIEGILLFVFSSWNKSVKIANKKNNVKKTALSIFVDYILPALLMITGVVCFALFYFEGNW